MSRSVVKTARTKFSKKTEEVSNNNTRHAYFEDEEEIDINSIRSSQDVLEKEEELNAGC